MTRTMIERQINLTRRNMITALDTGNTEAFANLAEDFKSLWEALDKLN